MRCFVGVFVPEPAKGEAIRAQSRLEHAPMVWKKVEPQNLHVNLSFLGELSEEDAKKAADRLELICKSHKEFTIVPRKISIIPSARRPRVLAMEAEEGTGELKSLMGDIVMSVGGDSKPPHITLGRIKSVLDVDGLASKVEKINSEISIVKAEFKVSTIDFIKSELGRDGPTYTSIRSCKLG
jgi:RNA 2',3'-cyclic 3'-phosphodiesterase